MLQVCFLLLTLTPWKCSATRNDQPPSNIAIIGGGIGGTSASYFLRKSFGESVDVDIYEKDSRLCGRLATVSIGGREYESGGSIIHPKNKYMKNFVKTLTGLEESTRDPGGFFGIFDGADYVFQSSRWSIISLLKMLWTFGLSLLKMNSIETRFLKDFERIYDLQEQGMAFENMTAFFEAMGGDRYTNVTEITSEMFFSDNGISNFMIDNLVNAGIRNNYGQNASVNAFVGAVAMAGIQPGLWSVKRGNKEVCYKLALNSSAVVIHEQVTKVRKEENGKFSIVTSHSNGTRRMYDMVILAAPVGGNMYKIDVTEACQGPPPSFNGKLYRRTVANFVRGKLNPKVFRCNSINSCPSAIFISNQEVFYRSIGYHLPVDYDPKEGTAVGVYKVFSTEPMTEEQRNYLFESHSETATVDWNAYPLYRPPDIPGSFVLNDGFYYTSPIEWAASAMEMSVIASKNAVLLAYNNWYNKGQPTRMLNGSKAEL